MTGKLITDLKLSQCRYATGEDERKRHIFCGEKVEYDGCPYCPAHAALCFDRRPEVLKRAHNQRAALARAGRAAQRAQTFLTGPVAVGGLPLQTETFGRDS
jgi:hypothetical protein